MLLGRVALAVSFVARRAVGTFAARKFRERWQWNRLEYR